jgi:hypothetical protein
MGFAYWRRRGEPECCALCLSVPQSPLGQAGHCAAGANKAAHHELAYQAGVRYDGGETHTEQSDGHSTSPPLGSLCPGDQDRGGVWRHRTRGMRSGYPAVQDQPGGSGKPGGTKASRALNRSKSRLGGHPRGRERGMLRTVALGALFLIATSQPVLAERGAKDEYGNHQRGHVGGGRLRLCAIQLCDSAARREPEMLRRLMEKRRPSCPAAP